MKTLENRVAIVTGAASGIGKAAAEFLAREGAKVVMSDISEETGDKAVLRHLMLQWFNAYGFYVQ